MLLGTICMCLVYFVVSFWHFKYIMLSLLIKKNDLINHMRDYLGIKEQVNFHRGKNKFALEIE